MRYTMDPRKLSTWITVAKILFLVAIIAWIARTFPKDDWDALVQQDKNWWLLAQAFLIILAAHLVSFWRWQILVRALEVPFSILEAIRLGFLGTMLTLVSVGSVGGDVFKAIAAARKAESKRTEVVASVLVDRAVGLLGLLLVAGISLCFGSHLSSQMLWIRAGALSFSLTGVLVLMAVVFAGHKLPIRWINRLPLVGHTLHRVAHACTIFQGRPRLVIELILTSMVVHSFFTIGCYFISRGLYVETPSLGIHFMTIPPAMAAATLPLTPGGVGVQEVAISRLFSEFPAIPAGFSGLIVAGMFRVMLIGVALIGGFYYLTSREETRKEESRKEETRE